MKSIQKIVLSAFFLVSLSPMVAQNNNRMYVEVTGELPSLSLGKEEIQKQQLTIDVGYLFSEKFNIAFRSGGGLIGKDSETSGFTKRFFSAGLTGDYYFIDVNRTSRLGLEIAGGYNGANLKDNTLLYDAITGQFAVKCLSKNITGKLGVRYNRYFEQKTGCSELFIGIGCRL